MPDYQPVPVDAARQLAEQYAKDVVIIMAWDRANNRTHTTSYGVTAPDKEHAAMGAGTCARALGLDVGAMQVHEDFHRDYDPAKYRALQEAARPFVEWARRRAQARRDRKLPPLRAESLHGTEAMFFGIGQESERPVDDVPRIGDLLRLAAAVEIAPRTEP